MHANSETGVLQPVEEIAAIVANSDALFHTDAAQTFGKEVECLRRLPYDFLSGSAHKVYGPKGIGVLCVRNGEARRRLGPIMFGGGQERGLRPGTLAIPLIAGLGCAAELAGREYQQRKASAEAVKREFLCSSARVDFHINGDESRSQSHIVNLSFAGVDSEALMIGAKRRASYLEWLGMHIGALRAKSCSAQCTYPMNGLNLRYAFLGAREYPRSRPSC